MERSSHKAIFVRRSGNATFMISFSSCQIMRSLKYCSILMQRLFSKRSLSSFTHQDLMIQLCLGGMMAVQQQPLTRQNNTKLISISLKTQMPIVYPKRHLNISRVNISSLSQMQLRSQKLKGFKRITSISLLESCQVCRRSILSSTRKYLRWLIVRRRDSMRG